MIRGGAFGEDFGYKLIICILSLGACIYDWRINNRKDYFWIFITGALIWTGTETIIQLFGTRVTQLKYLFGIDITNAFWLTIPIQGISEGATIAIVGIFFGDRFQNKKNRKIWIIIYILILMRFLVSLTSLFGGYSFLTVPVGELNVPSRRDMFPLISIIFFIILISIAIYWLITTDNKRRKRAFYMFCVMLVYTSFWTFMQWISGERWIEVGILNSDGSYTNLSRAPPLIEFLALTYDVVIEISLIYIPFLAIPYLIRRFVEKSEYIELKLKNKEKLIEKWMISK